MTRTLVLLLAAAVLLSACGRKNPPEVPADAGPAWFNQVPRMYGGGFQVGDEEKADVPAPPPAYFPAPAARSAGVGSGAAQPANPGVLTFPMPSQ